MKWKKILSGLLVSAFIFGVPAVEIRAVKFVKDSTNLKERVKIMSVPKFATTERQAGVSVTVSGFATNSPEWSVPVKGMKAHYVSIRAITSTDKVDAAEVMIVTDVQATTSADGKRRKFL